MDDFKYTAGYTTRKGKKYAWLRVKTDWQRETAIANTFKRDKADPDLYLREELENGIARYCACAIMGSSASCWDPDERPEELQS